MDPVTFGINVLKYSIEFRRCYEIEKREKALFLLKNNLMNHTNHPSFIRKTLDCCREIQEGNSYVEGLKPEEQVIMAYNLLRNEDIYLKIIALETLASIIKNVYSNKFYGFEDRWCDQTRVAVKNSGINLALRLIMRLTIVGIDDKGYVDDIKCKTIWPSSSSCIRGIIEEFHSVSFTEDKIKVAKEANITLRKIIGFINDNYNEAYYDFSDWDAVWRWNYAEDFYQYVYNNSYAAFKKAGNGAFCQMIEDEMIDSLAELVKNERCRNIVKPDIFDTFKDPLLFQRYKDSGEYDKYYEKKFICLAHLLDNLGYERRRNELILELQEVSENSRVYGSVAEEILNKLRLSLSPFVRQYNPSESCLIMDENEISSDALTYEQYEASYSKKQEITDDYDWWLGGYGGWPFSRYAVSKNYTGVRAASNDEHLGFSGVLTFKQNTKSLAGLKIFLGLQNLQEGLKFNVEVGKNSCQYRIELIDNVAGKVFIRQITAPLGYGKLYNSKDRLSFYTQAASNAFINHKKEFIRAINRDLEKRNTRILY